jgi:hypothetical protein
MGRILCIVLAIACVIQVCGAFSADSLVIDVKGEGDAEVTFRYSLTWIERFAVFFRIADPVEEFQLALEDYSGKPVRVTGVTDSAAIFFIPEFAACTVTENVRTYTTPALIFTDAEKILTKYWFAPFIAVDISPGKTLIRFPDGYEAVLLYMDQIPPVSHTMPLVPSLSSVS